MSVSAGSCRSCHLREGGLLAVHLIEGFKRERTHSVGHQVFRRALLELDHKQKI